MHITRNKSWSKLLFLVALSGCGARGEAQEIEVSVAREGGVYAANEKIVWRVQVGGEGAAGVQKVGYVLKKGGLTEVGRGELTLNVGAAELEATLDTPDTLLAEFTANVPDKKPIKALPGANEDLIAQNDQAGARNRRIT